MGSGVIMTPSFLRRGKDGQDKTTSSGCCGFGLDGTWLAVGLCFLVMMRMSI